MPRPSYSEFSMPPLISEGRHLKQEPIKSKRNKWLVLACVGLLLLGTGIAGASFLRLRSNVHTAALNLGQNTSGLVDGPLDILVIGSDTRTGNNAAYGDAADAKSGARSDVMMLVQVSQDKKNVSVLSFPRDLMVDIPECKDPQTNEVYKASQDTQINESLSHGGPGCTVATINSLTGINIDHFMLVDFNAVKSLSNVIGGVDVCVTQPIDDSYSGLKIPAGNSSVQGEQALAFLRSRHGFGDGSDTSRISAQQSFLASLLRKVKAEGTLSNPSQLMNIAEAITQNATVDQGLTNPANLAQVGSTLQGVDLNNIVFATVPHESYTYDENKLQLSSKAQDLFQRLKNDQSMIEPAPASSSASESSTADPSASASASEETVDKSALVSVLNGSGNSKRGDEVVSLLKKNHYSNAVESNAQTDYQASAIYYPAGSEALAQQLAQKLGITNVQESASYANVILLVGQDFAEGDSIKQTDSKIAGQADGQTAEQVKCQQSFEY